MDSIFFSLWDWFALSWFIACWVGYTFFARWHSRRQSNISNSLTALRGQWMRAMIDRDMRIADVTSLGILQRTVAFFASTTMFILAGLLAVLGASDKAIQLAQNLPFIVEQTKAAWELKILLLVFVFVYAFFKFSWSVRQYNFSLVMLGAVPERLTDNKDTFIEQANNLLATANNSFNFGLRAFNFAMAIIAWFVHPFIFIVASSWVLAILYRREFLSRSLAAINGANAALSRNNTN